ncbi:MAG: hypothetical protein Q8R07_06100 [Candidatus Uhrbacteria bacterium]|nr:hypothetical protein [Candidatus Uhrbacteria bacterium]
MNTTSDSPKDTAVVAPPSVTKGADELCTDWGPQFLSCASVYYRNLVEKRGTVAALADMKSRYDSDGRVKGECHQLTHIVGRAAAAKYDRASEAFAHGDSLCWSGYYHGVMEGIVQRSGKSSLTSSVLDGICSDIPGKERFSFDYYNCVHGLGHGIMNLRANNVFESLDNCDALTGGWEQSSCAGGVYMENVIADGREHSSAYLHPDDPLYPCNASPEKHRTTCYLMQTSYMLKITGNDFAKVFDLCLGAGEAYLDICYQSLGRDASGQSVSDVARTKATCMLGNDYRARSNCLVGAVKDFISYHHGDTQARALCSALDPELQPVCTSTADSYVQVL